MPELPEVETVCRGIEQYVINLAITAVNVFRSDLRWPIDLNVKSELLGLSITRVNRRAKYILLTSTKNSTLLIHLGMSGQLYVVNENQPYKKHDHFELIFENGLALRFCDPRRFGSVLWTTNPIEDHDRIKKLGPEPLSLDFNSNWLRKKIAGKKYKTKQLIMDNSVVVGVGNIYACESLFRSRLNPNKSCQILNIHHINNLVDNIKKTLTQAISEGGTTLKDFINIEGKPGYFNQSLQVYGKAGKKCLVCGELIHKSIIQSRTTYFCPKCQI